MKIFVQARKDGYNTLYPSQTPNEFRHFASDIILIRNEPENLHGKCVYSIAFGNDGYIFTQHIIVEDVQRAGLGNVGFSIFIPKDYKLSGDYIKKLLDELIKSYCKNYCNDFYLGNVQEDWMLFSSLANSYDSKLVSVSSEDNETNQSGNLDAAFIYFISDLELKKYFEQPNQEEYIPYRQIFFISNEFKIKSNPENPLYILKNSGIDLTGQIDLENPFYKLRDYHRVAKNDIAISIINSKGRPLYNNDKVYRKEEITIVYSKKNYEEKKIIGSLFNSEEIRNYLKVSTDNKIDVLKEINLKPKEASITFEVVKKDSSRVMDAVITCKNNFQREKQVLNNRVTFSGEDLNEKWTVSAKIGDTLFSNNHIIDFEKDSLIPIKLTLNERRKVKIIAIQEEEPKEPIYNFKVWVQGKVNSEQVDEVVFEGDEINNTFNITVEKEGYKRTDTLQYCPALNENPIYFKLKKVTRFESDKNKHQIEKEDNKGLRNKEIKFYQKPKFIIFSILSVLILIIGIWGLSHYFGKQENPEEKITAEQINEYLEGDELILSKLNAYKANWEMQNPQNNNNDEGFWSSIFPSDENQNSFEETDNWNQISNSIVSAITKRELIDKKDFEELREVHFNNQESFEKTIHKLNETKCKLLKEKLGDISSLSLSEIESKIEDILNKQDSKKDSKDSVEKQDPKTRPKDTEPEEKSGGAEKKEHKDTKKTGENTNETSGKKVHIDKDGNSEIPLSDISSDIKKYLRGDEIKYYKLEEYKSKIGDKKINESITIALKLWELDLTETKDKKEYLNQIERNSYLSGSKLNQFVKNSIKKDLNKWNRNKSLKEISNENN